MIKKGIKSLCLDLDCIQLLTSNLKRKLIYTPTEYYHIWYNWWQYDPDDINITKKFVMIFLISFTKSKR